MIASFELGPLPRVVFEPGSRTRISEIAAGYGRRVLIVTGTKALMASPHGPALLEAMRDRGLEVRRVAIDGEPTVDAVDGGVSEHRAWRVDVVVGIGGGSALDAAKAIAGLLPSGRSVMDHLEEVGRGVPFTGEATPLIAVPTTAGTGSEATRNAVIRRAGRGGFKRSFRHEALVPRWAIVDPDLLESCPPSLIAADGLDALTQLLESYVSRRAMPVTDALAEHGLRRVRDGLLPWHQGTGEPAAARASMAYAALLSGITLAHAGLGVVHGLAAPLGAWFDVPHGVACGTLLAASTSTNVAALRARDPSGAALTRYARAGGILEGGTNPGASVQDAADGLCARLDEWTTRLAMPRLRDFGVGDADVASIVAAGRAGSTKSNPVDLTDAEMTDIVLRRL